MLAEDLQRSQNESSESGQSLIEFAVSLVIVLILLAGIVDLGRAFFTYLSLRDAAQEGAAYASICPTNVNKIKERIKNTSSEPVDFGAAYIDITCQIVEGGVELGNCGTGSEMPGKGVRVRVTYNDFQITMPFMGTILGTQDVTLSAEATDTILRVTCID